MLQRMHDIFDGNIINYDTSKRGIHHGCTFGAHRLSRLRYKNPDLKFERFKISTSVTGREEAIAFPSHA